MIIHTEKFPFLKDFVVFYNKEHFSLDYLFEQLEDFYKNCSNDRIIREIQINNLKKTIYHKNFCPETLGFFAYCICTSRTLEKAKEMKTVANNSKFLPSFQHGFSLN